MVKVHISLEPDMASTAAGRELMRTRIEQVAALQDVDQHRFERHGILSAEIQNASAVPLIAALPGVAAVEPDAQRRAL